VSGIYLIPTAALGHTADVRPERLSADDNHWIAHSREILRKRRAAGAKADPSVYTAADHADVKPFGAEHCPVMRELTEAGILLKWPAAAILRRAGPAKWEIKNSTSDAFYFLYPQTSIPELGEVEALVVRTGWFAVTPPGCSVMIKAPPNDLKGPPLVLAEGIVRTDRATVPLFTHAFLPKSGPDEIHLRRGDPMLVLFPFRRESFEIEVVDDVAIVDEAERLAASARAASAVAPGSYERLHVEGGESSPLWEKLAAKKTPTS
jgi:hypothetical protein